MKVKEIVSQRYLNFFLYAAKGDIPKPITKSQPDWIMVGQGYGILDRQYFFGISTDQFIL